MRALLLAVLLGGFFASVAYAHGDARWIMQNPITAHCCSERDCKPLADGAVSITTAGYYIEGRKEIIPFKSAYASVDGRYWLCVTLGDSEEWPNGATRCFFAPATGA